MDFARTLTSGHLPTLIGAWLHLTLSFMVWLAIGALAVPIAAALQLSSLQTFTAVSVPLLAGAVLRIFAGWACDRFGAKATSHVLLCCQAVAMLWGWLGIDSYAQLLLFGMLIGAGGASFATTLPLGSRAYPAAHHGLAVGVVASGNVGAVLIAFFAPRWSALVGWHNVFGMLALMLVGVSLTFQWLVPPDAAPRAARHEHGWGALRAAGLGYRVGRLSVLYAVTFGGFVGLLSALPFLFHEYYGVGIVTAGTLTAVSGVIGSVIRPLGGYAADRVGGLRVLGVACPAIAVLLLALAGLPGLVVAVPLFMVTVSIMGLGNGAVFQLVAHWFPDRVGLVSGIVGAAGAVGGFFLSISLGYLERWTGSARFGLMVFAAMAVAAAVTIAQLRHRGPVIASSLAARTHPH